MVRFFDHVYLIVDGLDECGDDTNNVINGILDVIESSDNVSTAFLSRDKCKIRYRFEDDFTGIEITANSEDIDHGADAHVFGDEQIAPLQRVILSESSSEDPAATFSVVASPWCSTRASTGLSVAQSYSSRPRDGLAELP